VSALTDEELRRLADEAEVEWMEDGRQSMREMERQWSALGHAFSWIDPEPTYCPLSGWNGLFDDNFESAFPNPTYPCIRIMRLSLLGGGQIRVREHFKAIPAHWNCGPVDNCPKTELKVVAHTPGGGIIVAFGEKYLGWVSEVNAEAVVLRGRDRQAIADRTASTLRLIGFQAKNFFALLDGSEGCAICGRPLRDEISKLISVGPECARKYGVPHSREAAEQRLILRRKLLQEGAVN
jgi:Family of unknown function (DUF6011)